MSIAIARGVTDLPSNFLASLLVRYPFFIKKNFLIPGREEVVFQICLLSLALLPLGQSEEERRRESKGEDDLSDCQVR